MASRCSVDLVADPGEWDGLLSRVERPHMTQSWAYGAAKEVAAGWRTRRDLFDAGGWRARRVVFTRGGEPVAICQLLDKSFAGLRLASRLNRGPLFLDREPHGDVVRDVYGALRELWQHLRGALLLAPALTAGLENRRLLTDLGFRERRQPGWRSACLDLGLDEEELRRNLAPTWRNRLNKSERSGLELRVSQSLEDVDWLVARHVENMDDKDFSGPAPAFLRALCRAAPEDFLVFQARLEEAAVGGMLIYRYGHSAEYYVGWFGQEGRKANVGNFLYWQIVLELKRRGYRWFDLGGYASGQNFSHFKQGMRGEPYELLNEWLAF
jgi:hypothetical protein